MTKILSEDEKDKVLSSTAYYSEIVNGRNQMSMLTRAAAREEASSVYGKSHGFYQEKPIRDLGIASQH